MVRKIGEEWRDITTTDLSKRLEGKVGKEGGDCR